MRTAILSLFAAAALVVSARSAEALPPQYSYNNNSTLPQPIGPYYYNAAGAPIYNQNYIYPGYAYPYYYFNGATGPYGNHHYGSTGWNGGMRATPMSWRYGGNWNGRP